MTTQSRESPPIISAPPDGCRTRLREEAVEPVGSTPGEFQKYLLEQMAKYAKIVRATGMQND